GGFVGNGGVKAIGNQRIRLGVVRPFLVQQGIHFFMRDIDSFGGHHALHRPSLRTEGHNPLPKEHIQSSKLIGQVRETILIIGALDRLSFLLRLHADTSKKKTRRCRWATSTWTSWNPGASPAGMVAVIVSPVSGVLSIILRPVMLREAGHPER